MPSLPPETSQFSTEPIPWKPEYEMSIPCVYGPDTVTVQSRIATCEKRTWIPSIVAPSTRTPSSFTRRARSTVDAVLASDHGEVLDHHARGAHDDAALDDRARLPDEVHLLGDDDRPAMHARLERRRRRPGRERDAARPRAGSPLRPPTGRGARPAELASVLRVREP